MAFKVGARLYRVTVTAGRLSFDGDGCLGATLQSEGEILISASCPPHDRLRILLRELQRAWTYECGVPGDADGWLDLAATMARAAMVDLNLHSGEAALLALGAGETLEPKLIGLQSARHCGKCRSMVAGGSVACKTTNLPGVLELAMYCEFCGRTMRWREAQTARGTPSGELLGRMEFEAGDTTGVTCGLSGRG